MNSKHRQHLRHTIRQHRQALSPQQQQNAANAANHYLQQHQKIQQAQHIALFLSFDGEINTRPMIDQLWQNNKSVYLPVLHPFSRNHLLFLRYTPETPLVVNPFGIYEPKLDVRHVLPSAQLDVLVTPLVAFDQQGNRLGMGGGYYDRTLKNWQQKNIYPIGLAHNFQLVDDLLIESWDIPLPTIITPDRVWQWQQK